MKRDSHWITFLMVLLLSIALTSCAKSKTPSRGDKGTPAPGDPNAGRNPNINGNNNNNNNQSNSAMQGAWDTGCQWWYDEEYGWYTYSAKITVSGSNISEELTYWNDETCTDQWDSPETASATFTLGNQSGGFQEINLSSGLPDVRPFNIVSVSGNRMQFGDVYNGRDGRSAANRPNSLSTIVFNKR